MILIKELLLHEISNVSEQSLFVNSLSSPSCPSFHQYCFFPLNYHLLFRRGHHLFLFVSIIRFVISVSFIIISPSFISHPTKPHCFSATTTTPSTTRHFTNCLRPLVCGDSPTDHAICCQQKVSAGRLPPP
jgi:hypothetical protein